MKAIVWTCDKCAQEDAVTGLHGDLPSGWNRLTLSAPKTGEEGGILCVAELCPVCSHQIQNWLGGLSFMAPVSHSLHQGNIQTEGAIASTHLEPFFATKDEACTAASGTDRIARHCCLKAGHSGPCYPILHLRNAKRLELWAILDWAPLDGDES
jgi:hypothetical protein